MHLAESSEERQWLDENRGPFVEFRAQFGVDRRTNDEAQRPVVDYVKLLSSAARGLIVHGNFLTDAETKLIAARRNRLSLVYCPRTHHYFGHPRYPLANHLQHGVRVVLGTDSRASNPDLSIWREWQFAASQHSDVDPWRVFRMVTTDAAVSLGLQYVAGQLRPGHPAPLGLVRLDAGQTGSLAERLVESRWEVFPGEAK
jgi:cytosine/adenosine deaminase-related metal-dependent hydrolase